LIREYGSQALVTPDQGLQAVFQCLRVELSFQAHRCRYVVGGAFAFQLIQEPQALLGKGQGQRLVPLDAGYRW